MHSEMGFSPERKSSGFRLNNIETGYIKSINKRPAPIDPRSFDKYDPNIIAADIARVKELEEIFEKKHTPEQKEMKSFTDAIEVLLPDMAKYFAWMGEKTEMVRSSKYDDYENGIDATAEFEDSGHMGIALDFTINSEAKEKLSRIRNEIDTGNPPTVRYFKSSTFKGELTAVARVIIVLDRYVVDDVMSKKMDLDQARVNYSNPVYARKVPLLMKELANHPLQLDILKQIMCQLDYYLSLVLSKPDGSKNKQQFISMYESAKRNINQILEEKRDMQYEKEYLDQMNQLKVEGEETIEKLLAS